MRKILKTIGPLFLVVISITFDGCLIIDDQDLNQTCTSDCTTIEVRLTTEDAKALNDVPLELRWESDPVIGIGGQKTRKIKTGRTDLNGHYTFVFYAQDRELQEGSFVVTYDVPDQSYILLGGDAHFGLYDIHNRDTTVVANYHVPNNQAKITLKIKNPGAMAHGDRLSAHVTYKAGLEQRVNYSNESGLDSRVATEKTVVVAANQMGYIYISKDKNGEALGLRDSLFVPKHANIIYEIEF